MKVFAQWIKACPEDTGNEDYFRKNTILQFGDSWDVIGAAILLNPGSAWPTTEVIDDDTKSKLQVLTQAAEEGEWRAFKADPTMCFLEKIFSGWYIRQFVPLRGVILLYNLFNIRCVDSYEALNLRVKYHERPNMYTLPAELTRAEVPFYIGWGGAGKSDLINLAKELFEVVRDRVSYYTGEEFEKALLYHPQYINRQYRRPAVQNLLRRFLKSGDGNLVR